MAVESVRIPIETVDTQVEVLQFPTAVEGCKMCDLRRSIEESGSGIDWPAAVAELKHVEPYEEDDRQWKSVYLGSVSNLAPSGKYYLPFACSNVDGCPHCKGTGKGHDGDYCRFCDGMGSEEAAVDALWYEKAEAEAAKLGGCITSGEGDPTDVYFTIEIEEENEE